MGSSGETPASLEVKVYKEVCASGPGPCSVAAWLLHGQAHVSEEKPENASMLLQQFLRPINVQQLLRLQAPPAFFIQLSLSRQRKMRNASGVDKQLIQDGRDTLL